MHHQDSPIHHILLKHLTFVISETNGISLLDTLDLLLGQKSLHRESPEAHHLVAEFKDLVESYSIDRTSIDSLLKHPVSYAFFDFFKLFPLKYHEEHIHLTGSLTANFLLPRLQSLLSGPHGKLYEQKIREVYGQIDWPLDTPQKIDRLIRLGPGQGFKEYLRILYLPKLVLTDFESHHAAAYHMAHELYYHYNIGKIRLKFSISRASTLSHEQLPIEQEPEPKDIIMGLYSGFRDFQRRHPDFSFVLSPSFRKEAGFFDAKNFSTRKQHFEYLVDQIVTMLDDHPELQGVLTDVDTVGNETELYRKGHFQEFKKGFRKLQYRGIKIRSHHGETFHTLKKGIQAVDNAMNIWHIDTLEHGLSLGINPNYYFHRLYQRVMEQNRLGKALDSKGIEARELLELDWPEHNKGVLEKLMQGALLTPEEEILFLKSKFHTAREVEHYQHDVLNRMIQKGVNLITLPSSNNKLTGQLEDYKDHPFSWWEKKGVTLGLGTDNYVTLNTNYIQEMLILLYSDPRDLKITKLLMVTTDEHRRPYISHLLWRMHKQYTLS
jgi:adenosine deaminase